MIPKGCQKRRSLLLLLLMLAVGFSTVTLLREFTLGVHSHSIFYNHLVDDITEKTTNGCPRIDTSKDVKCALLFYGIPRLFDKALPSIRSNILSVNPHCDIYLHTYNQTSVSSGRKSEEINSTINYREVYDLTTNVVLDTPQDFDLAHDLQWYREHHHGGWGPCCLSTDNMIKAWHSIQRVWDYMEHCVKIGTGFDEPFYQRVGIFRLDVFYPHPIEITDQNEAAVVTSYLWDGLKNILGKEFSNDRMFYGKYEYARTWATKRWEFAPIYVENDTRNKGLHSESIIDSLFKHYNIPVEKKDTCFWRIRAIGLLYTFDCPAWDISKESLLSTSSIELNWLKDINCCWECTEGNQKNFEPCLIDTYNVDHS